MCKILSRFTKRWNGMASIVRDIVVPGLGQDCLHRLKRQVLQLSYRNMYIKRSKPGNVHLQEFGGVFPKLEIRFYIAHP